MSTDRDVERIVRSWMDEGVTQLPDRVLDLVLDQVPATPQRRAGWLARRFPFMNNTTVRYGIAAAVLAVAVILGISYLAGPNVGDDASPEPTPLPKAFNDVNGALAPGRYFVDGMPVRVSLTVPAGWENSGPAGPLGFGLSKPESDSSAEVLVAFWLVGRVYEDACDPLTLREVGPSVDELAEALAAVSSVAATTPTEASIDGFTGQYLTMERAVDCDGDYRLWTSADFTVGRTDVGQGVPAIDEIWVLDVDGTRLVIGIHSYTSAAPPDLAEAREMIESISFDPVN